MMDAIARAELDALRLRAYGPDADIHRDATAIARLAELEELALRDRLEPAPAVTGLSPVAEPDPDPPLDGVEQVLREEIGLDGTNSGRRSSRVGLLVGGSALIAVLAVAVAATAGPQEAPDAVPTVAATDAPPERSTQTDLIADGPLSIPLIIDRVSGEFIDVTSRPDVPVFPADGVTAWAQPLGVYYGWTLWVGRAGGEQGVENCLLLLNGSAIESLCRPSDSPADEAIAVSLSRNQLAPHQRPVQMTPDQRVIFTWAGGAYITAEITEAR